MCAILLFFKIIKKIVTSEFVSHNENKRRHKQSPMSSQFDLHCFESSDDEDDRSSIAISLSTKIMHGKSFRGKTLGEVVVSQRGRKYLRWSLDSYDGLHERARFHIEAVMKLYNEAKQAKE